jgi:hypothetical protein
MVPMGDFQNHHDKLANSYDIVNPLMHLHPDKMDTSLANNTYFSLEKYMNNYELVFTSVELECYSADIKGRFNRDAYLKNEEKRSLEYWNKMVSEEDNNLWELNYREGNISEDNESETESSEEEADEYADYGDEKPETKRPLTL